MGFFDSVADLGSSIGDGLGSLGESIFSAEDGFKNAVGSVNNFLQSESGQLLQSVVGSVGGNFLNRQASEEAFESSVELANTAHQRQVRDLEAAGLNPILSARLGGSPSPQRQIYPQTDFITPGLQTAISAKQTEGNIQHIAAQIKKANQEVRESISRENLNKEQIKLVTQQIPKAIAEATLARNRAGLAKVEEQVQRMKVQELRVLVTFLENELRVVSDDKNRDFFYRLRALKGTGATAALAGAGTQAADDLQKNILTVLGVAGAALAAVPVGRFGKAAYKAWTKKPVGFVNKGNWFHGGNYQ